MSGTTYYMTAGGVWKTEGQIVLDAIGIVCSQCATTGACDGCAVREVAERMGADDGASDGAGAEKVEFGDDGWAQCPICGEDVYDTDRYCAHCAAPIVR